MFIMCVSLPAFVIFFFFAVIQLPAPLMAAALFAYYPFFIISCGLKSAQSSALCLLIGKPKYS